MKLLEWVWSLLPDKCAMSNCCREGVRGNENRHYPAGNNVGEYFIVCDYCSSKLHRKASRQGESGNG